MYCFIGKINVSETWWFKLCSSKQSHSGVCNNKYNDLPDSDTLPVLYIGVICRESCC